MSATFFRYDGTVRTVLGDAIVGASIAVLTQPADTSTLPGSPLATIYAAPNSNAPTVSAASWLAGIATLTLNTIPADLAPGSFVEVSGINPSGYNGIVEVASVDAGALQITYELALNPGTYVSGGTLRTSALPNPFPTDALGNYFFYALPGIYTVQIFDLPNLPGEQLVLPDQNVVAGGGTGSVTSVGLTMPAEFNVSGSPVSSSGTFAVTKANQNANKVFAGPTSGGAAAPTFRSLVPADFPGGVGTVTSVALTVTVPGILNQSVTGSPVTSSGTLAIILTLANQAANTVFAGATSGGPSTPAFRALVTADLPASALNFSPSAFAPGTGTNNQVLFRLKLPVAVKFPAGAAASYATASANATGSTTFTLKKNGSSFATVNFGAGTAVGVWTQAADSTFAVGDLLEIDGPATADGTLADVGIVLVGTKQ